MYILITNDDDIHAFELLTLAQAMRAHGDVTILTSDRNRSGGTQLAVKKKYCQSYRQILLAYNA